MNIYRSIPVVMVGLWSSVLAAVLTVWKYVVYVSYPIRPLLHLVAFYPLLLVVVLGLWSVVWGYMLEDYDAFHLVWHESWKIGIPNGVLVAFTLGVYLGFGRLVSNGFLPGCKPRRMKSVRGR